MQRPDLTKIAALIVRLDPTSEEARALLDCLEWIDALEAQARIRAEQESERARAMMVAWGKGR